MCNCAWLVCVCVLKLISILQCTNMNRHTSLVSLVSSTRQIKWSIINSIHNQVYEWGNKTRASRRICDIRFLIISSVRSLSVMSSTRLLITPGPLTPTPHGWHLPCVTEAHVTPTPSGGGSACSAPAERSLFGISCCSFAFRSYTLNSDFNVFFWPVRPMTTRSTALSMYS